MLICYSLKRLRRSYISYSSIRVKTMDSVYFTFNLQVLLAGVS